MKPKTSQPNTIDEILAEYQIGFVVGEKDVNTHLEEFKAALLEAIKTVSPEKKDYNGGEWHPKQWCPRNNAIDEYEQNLINLFGSNSPEIPDSSKS